MREASRYGWRRVLEVTIGVALVFVATKLGAWDGGGAVAAEPPAGPAAENLRTLDQVPRVASYALDATLDAEHHTIAGKGTITFHNVSARPIDALYVHLYLNAFADEKTRFMRQPGSGFRGARMSSPGSIEVRAFRIREMGADVWPADATTESDALDRTDIRVPLPRAIAPDETIHAEVDFVSKLPSVVLRTGFAGSFHMAGQWFPKLAKLEDDGTFAHFPFERFSEFYADYGDYDVTVDVPSSFVVGATGGLDTSTSSDGRRRDRYLARGVHDFAFTAWDGFRESRDVAGDVAIRCLYPAGFDADASREIETAKEGLRVFGERYGAYPYATLTIVHPPTDAPEAGGMEYPTLITTGGSWWLAHSGTRAIELLTLHELAHQWFYGIVATNEHESPFLDEGGATYAAGVAAEVLYGDAQLTPLLPVGVAAGERVYAERVADHAPVASHADEFRTGSDYGRLVYYRAAATYRTIDRVYDGAFERALRRYARAERFRHPKPEALLAAIEAEGGVDARRVARAALFDQASIDLEATLLPSGEARISRRGALSLPVDIDAVDANGQRHRSTWDGAGDAFVVAADAPIEEVVADPEFRILLDENLLDNRAVRRPSPSPRVAALTLAAGQLFAHGVLP